jgi:capsular polysaccharide biosynthesis protein
MSDDEARPVTRGLGVSRRYLTLLVLGAVGAGLVVGLLAGLATKHTTPTFQSQALLEIDQPHALAVSADDGVIAKLSRLRFKYAGLLRTQTFAQPIATKLNLPVAVVANALYAGVDQETLVMGVGAKTHNREQTQEIAVAGAQELIDYTQREQSKLKIPVVDQVSFSIVTPASPAAKISPTHQRIVLVALGAFVFVTAGTLAFGYLWRRDY